MGLFKGQFANVVEWEEYRDDIIFWKWTNREIKKGSKLIIRAGQDAIFMVRLKVFLRTREALILNHRLFHSYQHLKALSLASTVE